MHTRSGAIPLLLLLLVAFSFAGVSASVFGLHLGGEQSKAQSDYSPPWSCRGLAAWCYHEWCPNVDGRGGDDAGCMEQCSNDHHGAQWKDQTCFTSWSQPPDTQSGWDCDELAFFCWDECGFDSSCSESCTGRRDSNNSCGWSGGGGWNDGEQYDFAGSDCMEIKKNGAVIGYEYCTWGNPGSDKCVVYDASGNEVCTQRASDWGNGGASSMQNCFYPSATFVDTGQSVGGTVWCESDYMNCHLGDQSGDDLDEGNLSLGAPSSCESGWDGGGCSMMSLDSTAMMGGNVSCPSFVDTSSSGSGTDSSSDDNGDSTATSGTKSAPAERRILNEAERRALEIARVKTLDYGDYAPCLYPPLTDLAWRTEDSTLYKDVHDAWNSKMKREHGITEEEYRALEACPEDVTPIGSDDISCKEIERKCQLQASPILEMEGEEVFATTVQVCMENKSKDLAESCVYSGGMEHARIREQVGGTCTEDHECGARGYCNTWDYREKPPKGHPLAAKVVEGVYLGRCEKLPAGKCLRDADCGPGSQCEQTRVCAAPPCFQQCRLTEILQEPVEDCRPFTREDVARRLRDEAGTDPVPGDIEKTYIQWIEDMGMSIEKFEQCDGEQTEDPSGEETEEKGMHPSAPNDPSSTMPTSGESGKVGRVFGNAVQMLLNLLERLQEQNSDLGFVELVRDGMRYFSDALLRIALREAEIGQEIMEAKSWVQRIRESLPEDIQVSIDSPEERGERQTIAFGHLRTMLREADEMLRENTGWVEQFLTELSILSYDGKDAAREKEWMKVLEKAQKRFYGTKDEQHTDGVMYVCGVFLADLYDATVGGAAFEGGDARLRQCGNRVEDIFRFLEKNMKDEVERHVPEEMLRKIMEVIGETPIGPPGGRDSGDGRDGDRSDDGGRDSGDQGSGDESGDACWQEVKKILGSERVRKLEQCAAKAGCGRDDHSQRCNEVWPRCFEQVATKPEMQLLEKGKACRDGDGEHGGGSGGTRGGRTAPPGTYDATFTIRSFIDGVSDVVIAGPKLFYRHHEFQAPGLWKSHTESHEKGKGEPTYIDGQAWQPKWGTVETYHCRGCTSDSYASPVSVENKEVIVVFGAARENAYVKEFPSDWNDWQLVLTFDDWGSGGAAWYEATIYVVADASDGGTGGGDGEHPIYAQRVTCEHDLYSRLSSEVAPYTTPAILGKAYCGEMGCYYKGENDADKGYCDSRGCTPEAEKFTSKLDFGPCHSMVAGGGGEGSGGGTHWGECRYDLVYTINGDGITYSKSNKIGKVLQRKNSDGGGQMDASGVWVELYVDDTGREYKNNTEVYVDYDSCDCDGDNAFDDCLPGPGTKMSCTHDQVAIGGKAAGEPITCDSHGDCRGKTTGLSYVMHGNVSMGRCDCDADGEYDDCGSGGGGAGGGMQEGDRCFYTNVQKNSQYIGYTVDCTRDGADCRYGSKDGNSIDMAGVTLGTERNCYYQQGGQPGGGTSGMHNCWYENASRNGEPFVDTRIWCEGDYVNCHFDSPTGTVVTFDGLSLGAPSSCEEGWNGSGGGGGMSTSETECVYRAYNVNSDATIGPQLSEIVMMNKDPNAYAGGGMGPGYVGVDSGTAYAPGTVEADYTSCDCGRWENSQAQPRDGVFDDCGGGGGGGYQSCTEYGVTIRSTGRDIGEGITCSGSQPFCTGAGTGKRYAPSALEWMNTCSDCDGDGQCDGGSGGGGTESTGGACVVIQSGKDVYSLHKDQPMFGDGYAFLYKSEYDFNAIQSVCTKSDYDSLMETHCQDADAASVTSEYMAVIFDNQGNVRESGCDEGCTTRTCPQPAAALPGRNIVNSLLRFLSLR